MSEPEQKKHETDASFPMRGQDYKPLPQDKKGGHVRTHSVVTIDATPDEVFNVYKRPELLHLWQEGVISVVQNGKKSLHWVVEDPSTGKQLQYDSEIVESVQGERHVSKITSGPLKGSTYTVNISEHPAGRGTIFSMVGDFNVPGGRISNAVASIASRGPDQILKEDVRHLKQLMESGEIPRVSGQPVGPRKVYSKLQRLMLGENVQPPPGTSDRPLPQDFPRKNAVEESSNFAGTAVLIAVPIIAATAIWGLFNRKQ